jgi:hypothetical protein
VRSETAVRRRRTAAAAVKGDHGRVLPQVKAGVVGLAGLEPAASSSAKCQEPLCGRSFPEVVSDRGVKVMRSIGGSVCVSSGLDVHARLATPSLGNHLVSILCTAVCLPSDHPHLEGCSAAMPGRALVLLDKEFGEAAQAPERSRFNGSKGKVQVCGYL